ncbi:MAG: hypothetical protein H6739_01430 [Alphaproteobacteria bacterium]|nr:hypothetical protein [Alphaproteobacteria bacterium]
MRERVWILSKPSPVADELTGLIAAAGISRAARPERATVWLVALPRSEAIEVLSRTLPPHVTVVDLSGTLRVGRMGRYALVDGDELVDGDPPFRGDRLACPAPLPAAVILGMRRAGLDRHDFIDGPIQVSAAAGVSVATEGRGGTMSLSRRLFHHPQAHEITTALSGIDVANFACMVSHAQPRGVMAIVTGRLTNRGLHRVIPTTEVDDFDLGLVLDTAEVRHRLVLQREGRGALFTLAVVMDDITFQATNAVRLVKALHGA